MGLHKKRYIKYNEFMRGSIKQLVTLATQSKKIWVLPVVLFLIIIALLIISAQLAPLPVFLYPIL